MKVHRVLPVLGVPVSDLTVEETLEEMAAMIEAGRPDFIATCNLDNAMCCRSDLPFREMLCAARLVAADGMPLIWASRLSGTPLRERVTGADLLPLACKMAAERGYRVFLMGGLPGTVDRAADRLATRYPGLRVVGTYCPRFASLEGLDHERMCDAVRRARADVLFTSLGSPKGTLWLARHLDALEVPVCLEVGAALTFAAGQAHRAPRWMRAGGGEWAYRLVQEPGRLGRRYRANARFLLRTLGGEALRCTDRLTRGPVGWALPTSGNGAAVSSVHTTAVTNEAVETTERMPASTSVAAQRAEGDRRRRQRGIFSEDDTWRVTRHIARRIETGLAVEADLRVRDVRRTNLFGALVWLHRRALRNRTELILHGLPPGTEQEGAQLGGPSFARWIANSLTRRL